MIIVLQCAATKSARAGRMRLRDGRPVKFVAEPTLAPADGGRVYARPDDLSDTGRSWREELVAYNANHGINPLGLLPAWELYSNKTYGLLADRIGISRCYILSAGWGLIRADFLTPDYDITFSASAEKYKRRRPRDSYADLRQLPEATDEPVLFFVSKEYVRLAHRLTECLSVPRHLFYNSANPPDVPGMNLIRYVTRTRTNWQYECAKAFLEGEFGAITGAKFGSR